MPSIPLDPTRWIYVSHPESQYTTGSIVVKSLGGVCFTTATSPGIKDAPEETEENVFSPTAVEVAENEEVTVTLPRYFKAKKQTSKEFTKPIILQVKAQSPEPVGSEQLAAGSVIGSKIAADVTKSSLFYQTAVLLPESVVKNGAGEFFIIPDAIVESKITSAMLSSSKLVKFSEKIIPSHFIFTSANWAVVGKTTTAKLVVDIINGKGAAPTITFGLNQVTATSETTKITEITYGTFITGSETVFTTPAAKTVAQKTTSGIALTGGASYSVGFTLGADTLAESLVVIHAKVYIDHA